jgi:anti-anti-sigma regulatory factor
LDKRKKNTPSSDAKQVWLECKYLHQVGLTQMCFSSFINRMLALRKEDVQIVLFGLSGSMQRMLRLLRLDSLSLQVPTLEDAYLLVGKQPIGAATAAGWTIHIPAIQPVHLEKQL